MMLLARNCAAAVAVQPFLPEVPSELVGENQFFLSDLLLL